MATQPLRLMSVWAVLFCLLIRTAVSQTPAPYSYLSPDPLYGSNNGSFSWPSGSSTYTFTEGSQMNISWTTDFPSVNLWLIVNTSWNNPITIASNYAGSWQQWQVDCGENCTEPFSFRLTNAAGSYDEQQHGGVYSRQFWIRPADGASSSVTSTLSTISTSSMSPTTASTSTSEVSSSSSTSSGATAAASAPAATASGDGGGGSNTNTTAIGAGVGVGVGVALLLVGGFILWRRYHRKMKAKYSSPQPWQDPNQNGWEAAPQGHSSRAQSRSDMSGMVKYGPIAEAPDDQRVEVPGYQTDPQELPGSPPMLHEERKSPTIR